MCSRAEVGLCRNVVLKLIYVLPTGKCKYKGKRQLLGLVVGLKIYNIRILDCHTDELDSFVQKGIKRWMNEIR